MQNRAHFTVVLHLSRGIFAFCDPSGIQDETPTHYWFPGRRQYFPSQGDGAGVPPVVWIIRQRGFELNRFVTSWLRYGTQSSRHLCFSTNAQHQNPTEPCSRAMFWLRGGLTLQKHCNANCRTKLRLCSVSAAACR